tara:strand:+ start:1775 stop:2038 length:264 start_codon:yes stop_codon:yes gene_type:complete
MSLFSGKVVWEKLVQQNSSLMGRPGLTKNGLTSTRFTEKLVTNGSGAVVCCPAADVLMNNKSGSLLTHRNKGGSITNCDCTDIGTVS